MITGNRQIWSVLSSFDWQTFQPLEIENREVCTWPSPPCPPPPPPPTITTQPFESEVFSSSQAVFSIVS